MPLFSKSGSIPKPQTDGTDGWVLVPDPPTVPEGKELVWLNWEWVVRDPIPQEVLNFKWKFIHSEFKSNLTSNGWMLCEIPNLSLLNDSNTLSNVQVMYDYSTTQIQTISN